MVKKIKAMSHIDITNSDYILDIDLDYFHIYDALNRKDLDDLRFLFARVNTITIATEPDFAQERVDTEFLLNELIILAKQENS